MLNPLNNITPLQNRNETVLKTASSRFFNYGNTNHKKKEILLTPSKMQQLPYPQKTSEKMGCSAPGHSYWRTHIMLTGDKMVIFEKMSPLFHL